MTAEPTSSPLTEFSTTLKQAVSAFRHESSNSTTSAQPGRPAAATVTEALVQAEKFAKQHRLSYPFNALWGQWRLCFVTGTRKARKRRGIELGRGFYIPKFVHASIAFSANPTIQDVADPGKISNQLQIGTLQLHLTGSAQYLGKKNVLAFDFTHLQLTVLKRSLYNGDFRGGTVQAQEFYHQPIAKLPFFAFFLITEDLIAARGRGGGLALWVKEL